MRWFALTLAFFLPFSLLEDWAKEVHFSMTPGAVFLNVPMKTLHLWQPFSGNLLRNDQSRKERIMKQFQQSTFTRAETTVTDVWRWGQELERLHTRIAPRFARPEPRRRALAYLKGIVSSVERKNSWQLAEHAGESRPDGMQRLLNSAVWDADLVRDDLRAYILERLGDPHAILVIDETSVRKRGKKSAGVSKQHCGTTGQLENCQVGVFLAYTSFKGCTLLDRELYLPLRWIEDSERCRAAGIPGEVRFATKPELAQRMVERIWHAQIPIAWVVADSVYGSNLDLRTWLEEHHYSYVMAVACTEVVGIRTPDGLKRLTVAEAETQVFHTDEWQRLSMSEGTKGPRLFDWAVMPILHRWEEDGRHFLLVRRRLDDPTEKTFYLVFAPPGTALAEMVQVIGARWGIEECFETAKEMGLEDYEVRCWTAWYRHVTLVMIVQACLAGICAAARASPIEREPTAATSSPLSLTIPEVRHLLAHLLWPLPRSALLVLGWSWWRRCHQSRASYFHTRRRTAGK
jgi:SRSO17 transposase